jgi:hypothetical protein
LKLRLKAEWSSNPASSAVSKHRALPDLQRAKGVLEAEAPDEYPRRYPGDLVEGALER